MTIHEHHILTLLAAPNLPSERRALHALLKARYDPNSKSSKLSPDAACALGVALDSHPFKDVETRLSLCWLLVRSNPLPAL